MTLILALANSDQVIHLSDRRITSGKKVVSDEYNKSCIVTCEDARLAVGFSGLAKVGDFITETSMTKMLAKAASPDFLASSMIKRFQDLLTQTFGDKRGLGTVSKRDKKTSFLITGYLTNIDPPLCVSALISNYQFIDYETDIAEDEFKVIYFTEKRPSDEVPTYIQRIGASQAMKKSDEVVLRNMLLERKPAKAIIGKAIELMWDMSEKAVSLGTIGKQLTSICIPRNPQERVISKYYTSHVTNELFSPNQVVAYNNLVIAGRGVHFINLVDNKVAGVPKVRSKSPCPCRSGKKYKHCHGR